MFIHNRLNQERWTHHIYKNKRGRVHTSFSHLNQSIIYRHYCLPLARPNSVYNNSARALEYAGICKHSIQGRRQGNMGSKLNQQSCLWEPLNIFIMVFSSRPPNERKEIKLFTRESSEQTQEEREISLGFLLIATTSMEIKLTNFFVFIKVYQAHKKKGRKRN